MQSAQPLISVVTIAFRNRNGLEQTLDSLKQQSFRGFESIVIDGGSADGTRELLEARTADIAYWCSEPDKGIADAFNKGVAKARGHWVYFLNSGDLLAAPASLELVAGQLAQLAANVDVFSGRIQYRYADGRLGDVLGKPFRRWQFEWEMSLPHQGIFLRRNYFDRFGPFDASFRLTMDYELLLRNPGLEVVTTRQIVAFMEPGGLSSTQIPNVLREFGRARRKNRSYPAVTHWLLYWGSVAKYWLSRVYRSN